MTACLENSSTVETRTDRAAELTTTLTLIDRSDRKNTTSFPVADRKSALELYRATGQGHDAHISTPMYDELILSTESV